MIHNKTNITFYNNYDDDNDDKCKNDNNYKILGNYNNVMILKLMMIITVTVKEVMVMIIMIMIIIMKIMVIIMIIMTMIGQKALLDLKKND